MTQDQIDALVEHWLESELDEADDWRVMNGPYGEDDLTGKWLILHDQLEDTIGALVSYDFRKVEREADELLKSAGLPALDHQGAEFGRLCRRLLQAKEQYLRTEMDRWDGKDISYKRVHNGVAARLATQVATPTIAVKSSPLFSVVVKSYLKENPKAVRSLPQVLGEFERFQ